MEETKKLTMEIFAGMSAIEIDNFVKLVVKPELKIRMVAEKADAMSKIKEQLQEGDFITVRWKDQEVMGTVVSLRNKTFSLLTEDILNPKGEPSRISRGYDFVLDIENKVPAEPVDDVISETETDTIVETVSALPAETEPDSDDLNVDMDVETA